MKYSFYLLLFAFILFFQAPYKSEAYSEKNKSKVLIEKTEPRGFDKKTLESLPPYQGKKINFYCSSEINLKKSQIREFKYLPKNKPSGYQLFKDVYIKAKASVSYFKEMVESINDNVGLYNSSVQNELDERLGKTDENSTEGGIEITWWF
ncbi:MAG: hypothetical protein RBR53_00045 [Desulforegulaceae bacterium]|nr:hypothetical protein [Desulforegulaceae bacterium]